MPRLSHSRRTSLWYVQSVTFLIRWLMMRVAARLDRSIEIQAQQGLAFAKEQYLRHLLLYNHLQEFMDDHRVQQHRHQQQLQQPTAHEPRITPPSKVRSLLMSNR